MSPLDRKLLRDLWRMRGQAIAISLVVAVGVMMLVMMNGIVNTLDETRQTYYDRYRLADIFAPVKRAPDHVLQDIAKIDGVGAVEGRVIGGALIDIESMAVPVRAMAVSLPDFGAPILNDVYLAVGRQISPRRRDEILLLKGFADAHGLEPGDEISATLNGSRRRFDIVGLAQSPEFIYATAPGEIMPDDRRFAVIWMSEEALAAAYDVDGAFNQALIDVARGVENKSVLTAVDRILEPYGGTGAYDLADQFSNRFVVEEINQQRMSSYITPPVFLAVAAFLLYIVVSRLIEAERIQIGLLKAFGYTSSEVGWHYLKFILAIAIAGTMIGCGLGVWSGRAMAAAFQQYYKFPFLVFVADPSVFLTAILISMSSATAGGLVVLRRVFALMPAEAMRPPAPDDFSKSASLIKTLKGVLDQPTRMIVRRLLRQPRRALAAIVGIAAGMSLSVGTLGIMAGFEDSFDLSFTVVDRSDATVIFIEPLGDKTIYELKRESGVFEVEPFRSVPVVLKHGVKSHRGEISGLIETPQLNRALDADLNPIAMHGGGIVLGAPLAKILSISTGDTLVVEVREGRRPVFEVPVTGIAETLLGAPAYMDLAALNRAMREPNRVSGAHLTIDEAQSAAIYERLKDMPGVAGVALREDVRRAFRRIMDSGAGAMRFIMAILAAIITFGIVYNSARIAFAERAHDLASLRVIGFTRNEAAYVLLGELALLTFLALPLGYLMGVGLAEAMAEGFSTDLYQIPANVGLESFGTAMLAVLVASVLSGWLVKRDIDRLDLVSALKSRE